jgi:hypothetical protein
MKGKLIKTPTQYILCVDEQEVQRFDAALDTMYGWVVADEYGSDIAKLSPKNCKAVELGIDLISVREGWINNYTLGWDKEHFDSYLPLVESEVETYMEGFLKALEVLGDKGFTEDEMFQMGGFNLSMKEAKQRVIKSIKDLRPKEWEVEIVMELKLTGKNAVDRSKYIPATDKNGYLILKPIL